MFVAQVVFVGKVLGAEGCPEFELREFGLHSILTTIFDDETKMKIDVDKLTGFLNDLLGKVLECLG